MIMFWGNPKIFRMSCKNKDHLVLTIKLKWNLLKVLISIAILRKKNSKIEIIKIIIHKSKAKKSQLLSGIILNLLPLKRKSIKLKFNLISKKIGMKIWN